MRFLGLLAVFVFAAAINAGAQAPGGQGGAPAAKPMVMTVMGFADGADIPVKFTQAGEQTSPAISWTNTPAGTVSFLLHMHDMKVFATTPRTISFIGWCGIFRQRQPAFRKPFPWELSCKMARIRRARAA